MTFPTQIPNISPTTDILIIIAIAAVTIVGSMIGAARLKLLSMSIYVGAGIAILAMPLLYSMIGSPGGFLSLVNFKFLALGICIGILGLTGGNAYHHASKNSGVINMVTAALSGLLLVTVSLMMMDPGARGATLNSSATASIIYDTRLAWLLAAPILLMVGGLIHGKRH
jgi:hypothetical protein